MESIKPFGSYFCTQTNDSCAEARLAQGAHLSVGFVGVHFSSSMAEINTS